MDVFVSWAGELSHKIALEIKDLLPQIMNEVDPFVSSENIEKGHNWNNEISQKLNDTNFGILCLTKDNLESSWLLFEAGALSKNIKEAKVCSILFDGLKQSDLSTPLSLFQTTKFEEDDFTKLIKSINNSLDKKLSDEVLKKSINKWWPDFKKKIDKIIKEYFPKIEKVNTDDRILDILHTTKYISQVVSRFNYNLPEESLDFARYISEDEPITFAGLDYNHPVKVVISPVNNGQGEIRKIEITNTGISESEAKIDTRGVFIELIFYSESDDFWSIYFHFHKGNTYVKTFKTDIDDLETESLRDTPIWRD